jgi:methylmalonyl-CoA mutase
MNSIHHPNIFMRSMATRQAHRAVSGSISDTLKIYKAAGFDFIIVETSGIGQSDTEILDHSDASLYVMTPEYGAATQLEKIDMLDFADLVAINKFDRKGALDALRDVRKQWARNRKIFDLKEADIPVVGTIASQFNDAGTWNLFFKLIETLNKKTNAGFEVPSSLKAPTTEARDALIPGNRVRYLAEISETIREYDQEIEQEATKAETLQHLKGTQEYLKAKAPPALSAEIETLEKDLKPSTLETIRTWPETKAKFEAPEYTFQVRDKKISIATHSESLSKIQVPKVATPRTSSWGDWVRFEGQENVPGKFPYTAGVFPFKREEEDPTRMFAGEGTPERTNRRFHYISKSMPAKRLSTAFDSVTLYGEDPDLRPDIYGKIGNSGVSICTLDDAKKLYSGFLLSDPRTSVSMTINGPAPMLVAFFLNAAIDQECERYIHAQGLEKDVEKKIAQIFKATHSARPKYSGPLPEGNDGLGLLLLGVTGKDVLPLDVYEKIKAETLTKVRGTVQADILKEDQAQNTCIFSTEFAIKMMGDIQGYFIDQKIRNFYSVSVSGYHIAEAGANPITQLAFTLSNGFTLVEYYLSRGYKIDDFAPNLSFFFSNGIDPEYAVIGRVARRIWAKAMKIRYGANPRSQMLKYHIQTSGRSLHAQEIDFNDIRTTLQALYAIFDNCNSLHTNAYDEAITTPTEESVRRAIAIQLIINKELGLAKNQNPFQGSYVIEELTDLVEEAVLKEFERLNERGGVLGAMETMYQRGKIQEESLYYETLKHTGELPVIGVNTYLSSQGSPTILPKEVIRSTEEEKMSQIENLKRFQECQAERSPSAITRLKKAALLNENVFDALMEAAPVLSLGEMTQALYEVGGQYRRNM